MAAMAATDCARSRTSILKHAGVDALSPPSLPEATGLRFDPSVLMPRTRSPPGLTFSLELSVEALNAGNRQGLPCYLPAIRDSIAATRSTVFWFWRSAQHARDP